MRESASPPEHDAVVLAGGSSRRMGQDKPGLYVGELTLLDRVLSAVPTARTVVVVGPSRPVGRDVVWTREDPPGSGPVAALAAGLADVTAPYVVLLAADLPFVTPAAVAALLAALPPVSRGRLSALPPVSRGRISRGFRMAEPSTGEIRARFVSAGEPQGAVLVDDTGRDQYLCSAWETAALRASDLTVDRPSRMVHQLAVARVALPAVPGVLPPWTDCDTPEDLEAARTRA